MLGRRKGSGSVHSKKCVAPPLPVLDHGQPAEHSPDRMSARPLGEASNPHAPREGRRAHCRPPPPEIYAIQMVSERRAPPASEIACG